MQRKYMLEKWPHNIMIWKENVYKFSKENIKGYQCEENITIYSRFSSNSEALASETITHY